MGLVGVGDYRQALVYFPKALAISRDAHLDWHRTCTHIGYGLALGAVGNYGEGLLNIAQGCELAESVGLTRLRSMGLDALGQHYQDLNLPKKAEAVHTQGMYLMLQAESTFWLPRLQANRAIDRLRQGDLHVGGDLLEALDITSKRGQEFHAVRCLEGLAELSIAQGKYQLALNYADQLAALAEPRDMREMLAQAFRWRGEALLAERDIPGAEAEFNRALELATWVGRVRLLWDIHSALAACRRVVGDFDAARHHDSCAHDILARITDGLPDHQMRTGLPMLQAS
jgi:tetratricopeptide (TPR) repeat protein